MRRGRRPRARLGEGDALDGFVLRSLFLGLGSFDVLDEGFFRRGFGRDDGGLLGTLGFLDDLELLDALLFLDNGPLDSEAFANHVLDRFSLDFESFLLVDAVELDFTFADHLFELAVFQDSLGLDANNALAVLAGNLDLAVLVLLGDLDFFVRPDARRFGLEPFFRLDLLERSCFACANRLDLPLLLRFGIRVLAIELEDDFRALDILFGDDFLLVVLELVGFDVLDRGELGDTPYTLSVEDVLRVEMLDGGLLKIVDGGVLERVAVQVTADDLDDGVAEFVALRIEVHEVELFAHGLERFGELGAEELVERFGR